jgi:ketosteroid isomerase-like protein
MPEVLPGDFLTQVQNGFLAGDANVAVKQEEAGNVERVKRVYQSLGLRDFDGVVELLHDDIELEIVGPPGAPFLGSWKGRAGVLDALRTNFAQVEAQQPQVQHVVAQGDTVTVVAREQGRFSATGRDYDLHWVQLLTFQGGKLLRVRELIAGSAG